MRAIPWKLLAAGAFSSLLLDLPFPLAGPLPEWRSVFAWFALVPMLVSIVRFGDSEGGMRLRSQLGWPFCAGWLAGALWFGSNCYWVYNTMYSYGNMSQLMAVVCLVLFSIYLGFWFGAFALALAVVRRATRGKRYFWLAWAAIPFLWTAMEFAIARIPEFPWDQLGYSQVDSGLLTRLAPWTGVYGISFVLAAGNAWVTELLRRGRSLGFGGSLLTLFFMFFLSFGGGHAVRPVTEAAAVLVQPNLDVDKDDVWIGAEWDRQIAQFGKLAQGFCNRNYIAGMPETGAAQGEVECGPNPTPPSLVIWPESPAPFRDADPRFQTAMKDVLEAGKAPVIVGDIGMDVDADNQSHIYNSASVIALDGRLIGRYDKIHLVPFGEYIPFRKLLFFAHQLTQNLSDMGSGADRKTFLIDGHRYGIFICYEAVFGDEIRQFARHGAEVLVNISDDGWYGDTSAPWQHLNMARMRAIENHRWILRDTNSGVTSAIDPYGMVRQSIPRHRVDALSAMYGYNSQLTFYTVHGDWLPSLCAILSLALLVWSVRVILGEVSSPVPAKTD